MSALAAATAACMLGRAEAGRECPPEAAPKAAEDAEDEQAAYVPTVHYDASKDIVLRFEALRDRELKVCAPDWLRLRPETARPVAGWPHSLVPPVCTSTEDHAPPCSLPHRAWSSCYGWPRGPASPCS